MTVSDHAGVYSATINAQGRIVVPADVRAALGLRSGDRLDFVLDGRAVRVLTAHTAAMEIWANNTGGDGGDSTEDVRDHRRRDQELVEARFARIGQGDGDADLTASDLLSRLGIA